MEWSTYWGPNFGSLADKLTPGTPVDPSTSEVATRGDLDRLGNRITWNTGDRPIPASYAPAADATMPAPVSQRRAGIGSGPTTRRAGPASLGVSRQKVRKVQKVMTVRATSPRFIIS